MKLRIYLLIASGTSIGFILISLTVSYLQMYLSLTETLWLSGVTVTAGIISLGIHYFLTRPLEQGIGTIIDQSNKIAAGDFNVLVPEIGPAEFRKLASQFNVMSRKLEASFEQLRSAETSRRELVANVSHDLRTPLTSIQSFVEALQDDVVKDKPTFDRYLETITLETKRLGLLIEDLFQLTRLQSGVEPFTPEPFHLDRLILETLHSMHFQLESKQIEIQTLLPDRLPHAMIMPSHIQRVLGNLLSNAIRHSPTKGKITLAVEEAAGRMLKVSVSDQGEGIGQGDLERVFDRFYRTDRSRHRESGGAGLGLAIAKSLVELHGGGIGVHSNERQGSTFWFTIPRYHYQHAIQ